MAVKTNTYIANLTTALGYFVAGHAGLLLAVPPSNAAVIWPASGVALAALLISGNRVLVGILLGGILVQTNSFLDDSSTERVISSFLIGTAVAAGATFQAWIGARLVRPILMHDAALLKERGIVLFTLLAGPVSCITSASIGIFVLWSTGIIATADLSLTWSTWWVGDSIGVLAFAPVILSFFAEPRTLWRTRIKSVAMPLCALIVVAFVAFHFSNRQEMRTVENEFERNAIRFKHELDNIISLHVEIANDLKEFFDNSDDVSEQQFSLYVRPKLSRHPEIQALEWIPMIRHQDRAAFEERSGAEISTPDQRGNMTRSAQRAFYFPIQFVEPYKGNEKAFGFDIRSNPLARAAADTACESGRIAATDAIKLVQETEEHIGIVFYAPAYRKDLSATRNDCGSLSGFAASVLRLEAEIGNIHRNFPKLKVSVSLKDRDRLFFRDAIDADDEHNIPSRFRFERVYPLPVANQTWEIVITPASGFITHYASWTIWTVIVGGFLISGLSGVGLLMLTGRALRTDELVRQRTTELDEEIDERKYAESVLAFEKKALETIVEDRPLNEVLDSIARGIERAIPETLCSILLLDSSGCHLTHGSAPSLPSEYVDAIDGVTIGPNVGSCGTAAYTNRQVIVGDISTDPSWRDFRDLALKHGLKACWSTPISYAGGNVLATFALYFAEPKEPDTRMLELIDGLASIVAIAILRRQAEERLVHQASHDALTGLANRREFERRAEHLLATVRQDNGEHALCFLDLDQFKVVNDTCGHTAGDEMLRQLSALLQHEVRKSDMLSRLGGDEFGVLMEHCSLEHAQRVAGSLQKVIQDFQFVWEGQSFKVGVSIGLVAVNENIVSLTELLKQADAACYMAKDLGRNRIHVYRPDDAELVQRHGEMQWVTRLHKALEENRFHLYAQVIVPLDARQKYHCELLLRMQDENGEIVQPGAFLPAAERYHLMDRLDSWVVETAFELLMKNRTFLDQIDCMSINLSGQSLTNEGFLAFVMAQFDATGISAHRICFEITETSAICNLNAATTFMAALKKRGCRFSLDDFGSGLSSFGYLKNLPVDFLKIDGMFVRDIVDDPIDRAMVRSINEIGHVMGMLTIAEFVETDEIKSMLRDIGVDYAQGYGVGKPQALSEFLNAANSPIST